MDKDVKIAVIGSGVMGEAIIARLLIEKMVLPEQIIASDTLVNRCEELKQKYQIQTTQENSAAVRQATLVVLAVKPQQLSKVVKTLNGNIPEKALVLSIVAGATLQSLMVGLEHPYVIRAMPNTPARIGEGITVWTSSSSVTAEQAGLARQFLTALGKEIGLDDENYLDMATALSGTGPAYTFLFMEAMVDAGVHLGFPRRIAEQLVAQTVRGSVDYYETRKEHLASLRNEVTSPGGTSAAALYYLEKSGFRTALSRAVWAAFERSQELGKGKDAQVPDKS